MMDRTNIAENGMNFSNQKALGALKVEDEHGRELAKPVPIGSKSVNALPVITGDMGTKTEEDDKLEEARLLAEQFGVPIESVLEGELTSEITKKEAMKKSLKIGGNKEEPIAEEKVEEVIKVEPIVVEEKIETVIEAVKEVPLITQITKEKQHQEALTTVYENKIKQLLEEINRLKKLESLNDSLSEALGTYRQKLIISELKSVYKTQLFIDYVSRHCNSEQLGGIIKGYYAFLEENKDNDMLSI